MAEASSGPVAGEANRKVFTVFGPRGGSGKTMLAVNLAVSLAKARPNQVALVDLSLTFGHCAMALDLVPKTSIAATSADSLSRLEGAGLEYYLSEHSSTLRLMAGARIPEEADMCTGDHVLAAINLLQRRFPAVVVDTAAVFNDATIVALERADKIILVCTPEFPTLRDIRECRRILFEVIHVPSEKIFYVMNNPFPFKPLALEQFVQALEQSIHEEIPFGGDAPSKAVNRGEPLVIAQAGSPPAKAIDKIARAFEAEMFPPQTPERRGLFNRR
jgi:pilus assembly protein CpaE